MFVLLIFYLKHNQSNIFLTFYFTRRLWHPIKHGERAISYWTDFEINAGAQVTWGNKPTTYIHIPVKVK